MARTAHSRKRVTLNVVLSDIGKITQGETDQLVSLFDEAQQTALANDILAKRAQEAEEQVRELKAQVDRQHDEIWKLQNPLHVYRMRQTEQKKDCLSCKFDGGRMPSPNSDRCKCQNPRVDGWPDYSGCSKHELKEALDEPHGA
jgi:hypothetical protein